MARPRSVDRSIEIKFLADLAQLKAGAKAAEQSLGGLSGKAFQMSNAMNVIQMAVEVGQTAINTWIQLAQAASDYDQALGKLNAVFGDASGVITDFAKTSAEAWGQSRTAAINFAGDIGNVFTSMGVARSEAAKMSVVTMKLASDMAAFANLPVEEALLAIKSGLVGETEPLRRFGILVYDAAVKSEALAQGIWDGKDAMTDAEKVTARFSLMQRRGANMTGSFAREVDTLQVQTQKLRAEWADLQVVLGSGAIEDSTVSITKSFRGLIIIADDLATSWNKAQASMSPAARNLNDALRATTMTGGFELLLKQLADVADRADATAASFDHAASAQAAANAVAATTETYARGVTDAINAKIGALKNEKTAIDNVYKSTQTYLEGMSAMTSAVEAAFEALDSPTLRQTLNKKWKVLTTDSFVKSINSGNPERKKRAEYAAMTFGRGLVESGKKFKPTGNPVVDKWIKKGMEDSNWHKSIDTLLARLQTYLNQNPLTVNISEIMRITGKRKAGTGGSNQGQRPLSDTGGGIAITVNTGVGDPVAIGREVSRVLGAYSTRAGHI
jgi:hypothetical protein